MKLYFNKTFGEYICAGNGVAAMDKEKANAIKMALEIIERGYDAHLELEENKATGN